ncbi:DUF835 domain-containing protein [Candidatus Woesearchaeota archaeon]|nr:DUF835 domain-containing protein [Candidatus Woesearchaeota archaeon]
MLYLLIVTGALAALMYMLLQKMKTSPNKEENVWVTSFLVVNALFAYAAAASVLLVFSTMAVIESVSFWLFAGLMLLVTGMTTPVNYYLIERIKYTEKYEKRAKQLEHPVLVPGFTYVVEEPKTERSMQLFSEMLAKGATGLCITRTNPKELKEAHKEYENVKLYWLTEIAGEGNLRPTDLEELSYHITNFINTAQNAVIYLDGFEYLVNYNSFTKILHLFQVLKDTISIKKATMVMPLNPGTFEPQNLKMVELEFKVV